MALSVNTVKRMIHALTSRTAGNELASAVNLALAQGAQNAAFIAAAIVATSTSTTTDFAALAVGDKLIHIPASAGNSNWAAVSVAGTAPAAAVIGDLYIALRAPAAAPAASNVKL